MTDTHRERASLGAGSAWPPSSPPRVNRATLWFSASPKDAICASAASAASSFSWSDGREVRRRQHSQAVRRHAQANQRLSQITKDSGGAPSKRSERPSRSPVDELCRQRDYAAAISRVVLTGSFNTLQSALRLASRGRTRSVSQKKMLAVETPTCPATSATDTRRLTRASRR